MTKRQTPRWGWALTGSGHFLKESLALIHELEHVDLFLSKAGSEVLRMYKQDLDLPRSVRIYRDTSASSVTVGTILLRNLSYVDRRSRTSNAVAKFVYGFDDFISNVSPKRENAAFQRLSSPATRRPNSRQKRERNVEGLSTPDRF
jgi:flavoprotein